MLKATQKATHDQLKDHPTGFFKELTVGYIRMLDEARLSEEAREHGRSREQVFREDANVARSREGKVRLWPTEHHNIGTWDHPDLGFDGFDVYAKGLNKENEENLFNSSPQALPLTLDFEFVATNPVSGFWHPGKIIVGFVRDPDGHIFVSDEHLTDDVSAWLASYYTGRSEHSDDELEKYAPLGATKLYAEIKTKPISGRA
jgi:hypothetical protein